MKHGKVHLAAAWLSTPSDPGTRRQPGLFQQQQRDRQNDSALPAEGSRRSRGKTIAVLAGSPQAATLRDLQAGRQAA